MMWYRMELGCKEQGDWRLPVGHSILASIAEESGHFTFKPGLPGHYVEIFMKTTGYNYFLNHLLA